MTSERNAGETARTGRLPEEDGLHWYAVKAQPRKERLAVEVLTTREEVEAFCPFLTRKKKTRVRGWHAATEPVFPGYLFARFELGPDWRRVTHAHGVAGLVRFETHVPVIPDGIIGELKRIEEEKAKAEAEAGESFQAGDRVEITEGPLAGMTAEVLSGMTRKQRVALLLDFLGSRAELDPSALTRREE